MGEDGRVWILNEYLFGKETIIQFLLTSYMTPQLDLLRISQERLLFRSEGGRSKAGKDKVWLMERMLGRLRLRLRLVEGMLGRLRVRLRLVVREEGWWAEEA